LAAAPLRPARHNARFAQAQKQRIGMNVRLNLASNPLQMHRRFLAGSTLVGTVAAIVFLALGWHVYSVRKADEALNTRIDQASREMAALIRQHEALEQFFKRPENARLADRSAYLNTLIDAKSLNWTRMFMDLEKVMPPGVRLISIEPHIEKGQVQIRFQAHAANDEAKLQFLRVLEKSPAFSGVIENQEIPDERGGGVQLSLVAIYMRA
jgi:type IV pilus assembly protein PilN